LNSPRGRTNGPRRSSQLFCWLVDLTKSAPSPAVRTPTSLATGLRFDQALGQTAPYRREGDLMYNSLPFSCILLARESMIYAVVTSLPTAMKRQRKPDYEYDIALSYAGQERRVAQTLAEMLRAAGLSVFFDRHRIAHLWGKDDREFARIYGPASRFVAPIISKHYVAKDWPKYEFNCALREERNRSTESILPTSAHELSPCSERI